MNIICKYCGKKIKDDDNCQYCGAPFQVRLEEDEEWISLNDLVLVGEYWANGRKTKCYEEYTYDEAWFL